MKPSWWVDFFLRDLEMVDANLEMVDANLEMVDANLELVDD